MVARSRVVADGGQGSSFTMCRLLALDSGLGHVASGELSAVLVRGCQSC